MLGLKLAENLLTQKLHDIFIANPGKTAELIIEGLTATHMNDVMLYIFHHCYQWMDTAFIRLETGAEVSMPSPRSASRALAGNEVVGVLWVFLGIEGYRLPLMGIYVDAPETIAINFETGAHWHLLTLSAFFECLHDIHALAPDARIRLNPEDFDPQHCNHFDTVLKDDLHGSR